MIRAEQLAFKYSGASTQAVRDLSFEVAEGEIFGFLGPSGAGKSTTQKILTGLLRDFEGEARVMDRSLHEWRASDYEHVGVSFEVPNLYLRLTASENLRHFAALYGVATEFPESLLEQVGLLQDAETRVSQFSKGMKVRLGFARALLHRPKLLFLDEPTAGLDPGNARNIKEMITNLKGDGRTVFLTTHDMAVADQLCDRVAFIVDGTLRSVDSPRNLRIRHGRREVRVEYRAGETLESRRFPLEALGDNGAFQALLSAEQIETIHTQEMTLEDVFIAVTGEQLV